MGRTTDILSRLADLERRVAILEGNEDLVLTPSKESSLTSDDEIVVKRRGRPRKEEKITNEAFAESEGEVHP
jgi:hypothetical protein